MYYLNDPIQTLPIEAFNDLNLSNESHYFAVVSKGDEVHIKNQTDLHKVYSSKGYTLYEGITSSAGSDK